MFFSPSSRAHGFPLESSRRGSSEMTGRQSEFRANSCSFSGQYSCGNLLDFPVMPVPPFA